MTDGTMQALARSETCRMRNTHTFFRLLGDSKHHFTRLCSSERSLYYDNGVQALPNLTITSHG
jgi:hypothetical protein